MKNKSVVLAVIALVVVAGVVVAIAIGGNKSDTSTPASSSDSMSDMNMNDQSNSESGSGSTSDAVAATSVEIKDYAYSPQIIKVKVGDKVAWTNKDSVKHDVTSDSGVSNGPQSALLAQGESYTFTFTKAGTYTYHCSPHPYMKATVIVE